MGYFRIEGLDVLVEESIDHDKAFTFFRELEELEKKLGVHLHYDDAVLDVVLAPWSFRPPSGRE